MKTKTKFKMMANEICGPQTDIEKEEKPHHSNPKFLEFKREQCDGKG